MKSHDFIKWTGEAAVNVWGNAFPVLTFFRFHKNAYFTNQNPRKNLIRRERDQEMIKIVKLPNNGFRMEITYLKKKKWWVGCGSTLSLIPVFNGPVNHQVFKTTLVCIASPCPKRESMDNFTREHWFLDFWTRNTPFRNVRKNVL